MTPFKLDSKSLRLKERKVLYEAFGKKFEAAKVKPHRILKEFKVGNINDFNVGDIIEARVFSEGEK